MSENTRAHEISDAIAYGWDGGKARAFEALRPYVRHLVTCSVLDRDEPNDERCTCGLRLAWRIRETPEAAPAAERAGGGGR